MKIVVNTDKLLFIRVTQGEALKLIMSLSGQLYEKNPNTHRDETFATNGVDVSIAIDFKEGV